MRKILSLCFRRVTLLHSISGFFKRFDNFYFQDYFYVLAQVIIVIVIAIYRLSTATDDIVTESYYSVLLLLIVGLIIYLSIRAIQVYKGKKLY